MAMNDDDKWASQILNEMLEKLAKADTSVALFANITKNKHQDGSKEISNVITKDISCQESKKTENQTSSSKSKYEEDSDISSQSGESRDVIHQIPGQNLKQKILLKENVMNCDKIIDENHKSSGELTISDHEPAETLKRRYETSNESKKKDNLTDNAVLDDSVVLICDSCEFKNKDLPTDYCKDFLGENFLETNIDDTERFQLRNDVDINSVDDINSGLLGNNYESEELLHQNPRQIEEKSCRVEFCNRHDEDRTKTLQDGLFVYSYNEHIADKLIKQEIDNADGGSATKSCPDFKTGSMLAKLVTENCEKTENVELKIKSQGDCSNFEIENKEDSPGHITNHLIEDTNPKMILPKRNVGNTFVDCEESYEDRYSDKRYENRNNFDLKNFKNITDLAPLIETIAFYLAMDSTTDTDLVAHTKRNDYIPRRPNDVSPRTDASNDPIVAQRYFKVISMYRYTCRAFEDLFLNPFAMFIAESIDTMIFFFFLSVSAFYMLYKSIKIDFFTFLNSKNKLSDLLKIKNQSVEKSSNACSSLTSDFKNESDINNKFEDSDSMSSFSSYLEDIETQENKKEINVAPEEVNILNDVWEYANQTLDDFYEKGSKYLENFCNKNTTDVAKSHEDIFVDITLKGGSMQSIEKNQTEHNDGNIRQTDLMQNIVKSSDHKIISDDIPERVYLSDVTEADPNESHSMEFSVWFKKSQANIFNSTEIDDPISDKLSKSTYKTLSPSEINIFDSLCNSCETPGITCGNILRSSSLSVNANSFPSISSIRSRSCSSSRYSLDALKADTSFQERSFDIDPIRMGQGSDAIRRSNETTESSSKNRTQVDGLHFHKEPKNLKKTTVSRQPGEPHVDDTEESYNLETPGNLFSIAESTSKYSDMSGHLSPVDAEEEHANHSYYNDSLVYDSPESFSYSVSTDDAYNENCFMDFDETTISNASVLKKKSGRKLRRRMSGIFNNLRDVGLMQCVMSSAKRHKKYKKQTDGCDE